MAEDLVHFTGIRLRLQGSGNFIPSIEDLGGNSISMRALSMNVETAIEPTRLCNKITQRARIRLKTTEIDEYFIVNRLIIYIKPIYTSLPSAING